VGGETDNAKKVTLAKEMFEKLNTAIDDAVQRTKVAKPQKNARPVFDEDEMVEITSVKEEEIAFQAYKKFCSDVEELKEEGAKTVKEVEQLAGNVAEQTRIQGNASRVAAMKGVPVDKLKPIIAQTLDIPPELTTVMFAPHFLCRRFEKAHGVVIDQSGGKGKGKGKGAGIPQIRLIGEEADCTAASQAIKATDVSYMQKVSIEGRRVGGIIGSGGEGLRKMEDKYKIFLFSTRDEILGCGAQEKVQKAIKELDNMLADASVDSKEDIPIDIAKYLINESGKAVRGFESETGALIKVNMPQYGEVASVNIKGSKDSVEKATKKIKAFCLSTSTETVKADSEAIQRLFGQRSGKGGDVATKFQEIKDKFEIAVVRKPDAIVLIGDKKKVTAAKKAVEEAVVRAAWTQDTFSLENREQARVVEGIITGIATQSGAEVTMRRAGKGGDAWLEIYGSNTAKESAKSLLNAQLDKEARVRSLQVPVAAVSLFLAKGGQAIRDLEKSSGCSISLNRSDGSVTVLGPKGNLDKAETTIKNTADKFDKQQANMTTEEMTIDADDVGLVVGKSGSTVKTITRTSGAEITIARDSTTITISGSADQVQTAKKLITETIERKGPPEEETWTETTTVAPTPKPKKIEKKENAPDLEAKEVFPSLGAALAGAGSKRAMKSAKMQLNKKAEEPEVNGNSAFEPPARNGHVSNGPAVLFETKQSSVGQIAGSHPNYWKDFRAESAKEIQKLAETED
jgi:rRNA processing protein Krr1/Pno1